MALKTGRERKLSIVRTDPFTVASVSWWDNLS